MKEIKQIFLESETPTLKMFFTINFSLTSSLYIFLLTEKLHFTIFYINAIKRCRLSVNLILKLILLKKTKVTNFPVKLNCLTVKKQPPDMFYKKKVFLKIS